MKAYIFTRYASDKRDRILEKKVIVSDKKRFDIIKLNPANTTNEWEECDVEFQPQLNKGKYLSLELESMFTPEKKS